MIQPLLYIITEHSLDFSNKEKCVELIQNQDIRQELEQYLFYVSHLGNTKAAEAQQLQLKQLKQHEISLFVNDIEIKIRRHIIQLCFPFIFRSFFDYEPLQKAIETLLKKCFSSFGANEYIAYPSFWNQTFTEVRNPQHERRLAILQDKICNQCVSYKRTKLNLELCLREATTTPQAMQRKRYRGWFVGGRID